MLWNYFQVALATISFLLKITGFDLRVTQMTGIMVMAGNKQECGCQNGRWEEDGGEGGAASLRHPFLNTLRSVHRVDLHMKAVTHSVQYMPLYVLPTIHTFKNRMGQANFHPGSIMLLIWVCWPGGERLALPWEGRVRTNAPLCVLHHRIILLSL